MHLLVVDKCVVELKVLEILLSFILLFWVALLCTFLSIYSILQSWNSPLSFINALRLIKIIQLCLLLIINWLYFSTLRNVVISEHVEHGWVMRANGSKWFVYWHFHALIVDLAQFLIFLMPCLLLRLSWCCENGPLSDIIISIISRVHGRRHIGDYQSLYACLVGITTLRTLWLLYGSINYVSPRIV